MQHEIHDILMYWQEAHADTFTLDVFISVITIVNLLKSIVQFILICHPLFSITSTNTCIREFGICQHGRGKNWQKELVLFKYLKKKLLAQGLSFKELWKPGGDRCKFYFFRIYNNFQLKKADNPIVQRTNVTLFSLRRTKKYLEQHYYIFISEKWNECLKI